MAGGSELTGLVLPTMPVYITSVVLSAAPKLAVIVLACVVAAFRADLFFSAINESGRNDLPVEICFYSEDNGDYRGDRICNSAMANAIVSILVAMALIMIDLVIPCLNTKFARLAHIHTLTWAVMMAVFWCVSGSLLADLFNRFSDRVDLLSESPGEFDRRHRFNIFVVFSFLCMAGWGAIGFISSVRIFLKIRKFVLATQTSSLI